jgi:hypothetical protein
LITVCANSITVGAVLTFSTAVDTTASAVIFSVKEVVAVSNAATVFAETVATVGMAAAADVVAVFVATTAVTAAFKTAICALAASMADCTTAVLGSGIGVNVAP